MKKRSKRIFIGGIIIIIFIIVLLLYFKPLTLSDLVKENQEILITQVEMGYEDGKAYTNSKNYNNLTDGQKNNIINLFDQYAYQRTFGTIISNGSLSGLSDKLIYIFIYENNELIDTISISSSGSMSLNDKSYILQNAQELIAELLAIISK